MDRAIPVAAQRHRTRRRTLLAVVGLLALAGAVLALRRALRPALRRDDVLTARVETGDVDATLSAAGTVIPGREAVIVSPIQSTIRRVAVAVGARVQPGQTILELEKDQAAAALAQLDDEQQRNQNKNAQLALTLERSLTDLQSQAAAQQVRVRGLELALHDEQHLLAVGGGTPEAVRQATLNLAVARLEAERLTRQARLQRRTAAADVRELGFTVSMQQRSIRGLAAKLRQASISSALPGVVTWVNENLGATVQAGDALARVADLSSFRVRATISDSYADQLRPDGPVRVRLGTNDLRGHISSISPAVEKGVVTFYALLDQPHHPALRANLRADIFVITNAQRGVLRLRNGAFYKGGREQPVFVVAQGRAVRRTVQLGISDFDYVQVLSGLQAGDEVVVSDMKDHLETPELVLE